MNFKQLLFLLMVVFVCQSQIVSCPGFDVVNDECMCFNPVPEDDGQGNEYCEVTCQCSNIVNEIDLTQAESECKSTTDPNLWFVADGQVGCEIDCAGGFRSQAGSLTTSTTDQTCSVCAAACESDENCWAYSCATLRKEDGNQLVNKCQFSTEQQSLTEEVVQAQATLYCVREFTVAPTGAPTNTPTVTPSNFPTTIPTLAPSVVPTAMPSFGPTVVPTFAPSDVPTTMVPTDSPTQLPSSAPSIAETKVLAAYVEVLPSALQPYWYVVPAVAALFLLCLARTLYVSCCRKEPKELATDGEFDDFENQVEFQYEIPPKRRTKQRRKDSKRNPHTTTPEVESQPVKEERDIEEAHCDLRE